MDSHETNGKSTENGAPTQEMELLEVPATVFNGGSSGSKGLPSSASQATIQTVDREQWDKPVEFLLSCISMSVGLGNVWRFPFIAYKNGGGAFILVYIVILFFIGKPMYFLEMSIGQFCSKGQIKVWKMLPFFKGIGYASAFGVACLCSFYCVLMALTVFYFFQSFQSTLPWSVCQEQWNLHGDYCKIANGSNDTWVLANSTDTVDKTIPGLYFTLSVIKEKTSIDDGIGDPNWKLTLCLLASWICVGFTLVRGVQSAGKVAYFTALFPYVVMFIFLIRGLTLPGAWNGIWYLLYPEVSQLYNPKVWLEAVTQCFFSLSTGFGPIIMYSSYNNFEHNVYKDAFIVSIMDTFTSLLAGVTIFSILGNLAYRSGTDLDKVVAPGPGLAFISYPDAMARFDFIPQFFSILFFFMLFVLGLGSATSLANALITILHDQFYTVIEKKWITLTVCVLGFLSGLVYVTPGGMWILELVDYFGAGSVIYLIAILELVGMVWIYGLNNIVYDLEFMLRRPISLFWRWCWVIIPIPLLIVLFYNMIWGKPLQHNDSDYPTSAMWSGRMLLGIAMLFLPVCALHSVFSQPQDGFLEKLKSSFNPVEEEWGPNNLATKMKWQAKRPKSRFSLKTLLESRSRPCQRIC